VDEVTRATYDTVSESYAKLLEDELANKPIDRAFLMAFAELVGDGRVLDAGCGAGRVTAFLRDIGVDVYGIDLSPRMIEVARRSHPDLSFTVGDITQFAADDASLGGVLAWYSTIHTPSAELPVVLREFRRVLRADGRLLLAFQTGEGSVHRTSAYGHDNVDLTTYYRSVDEFRMLLGDAGFAIHTYAEREPEGFEKTRQAYVLA
jgi:ubiquinone/menaquinone biosynthesis C-methylase UbiE